MKAVEYQRELPVKIDPSLPWTALAPMQDVTDHAFIHLISDRGAPDIFVTEYFRVHVHSRPEAHILKSITENETGRPVFAQLIGESIPDIVRTIKELQRYPVAGIDLNMGCPAPKVYKKNVGGGLLREVDKVRRIFEAMRENIPGLFTVKMRIGFDGDESFDAILDLINEYEVDLLTIHGRTVKQLYRGEVFYDRIEHAARRVNCPVLANGNVTSASVASEVLKDSAIAGVMIGRSAIRNPWIFRQTRERQRGEPIYRPTMLEVRQYVQDLYDITRESIPDDLPCVNRMKKYLNFLGQGVDPEGGFLHQMRRCRGEKELFDVCDRWLIENGRDTELFPEEPFDLVARPNHEDEA